MGRFLVIGMATRIVAVKKEVIGCFFSGGFRNREVLLDTLNKRFNAHGIYDIEEDDEEIRLVLKPDVAQKEWISFLRSFYKLRYGNEDFEGVIDDLSKQNSLQSWLEIASRKEYESYQADRLYSFPISDEKQDNRAHLVIDYVILSLTGKIIMECYAQLFEFFTRLIRERLPEFRLADGLIIDITD